MMNIIINHNKKHKSLEKMLAFHAAPTLLGIKSANLFTYSKNSIMSDGILDYIEQFNFIAEQKGLRLKILCECHQRALILAYRPTVLEKKLNENERQNLLLSYGYSKTFSLEDKLNLLGKRIEQSDGFPHEIGIFLDYPIGDVVGFIENSGQNFKFSGYWKVYENEEQAKRIFANYTKCRVHLCNKLKQGFDLYQALKIA